MFIVYDDMTVSLNRGDVGVIPVPQSKDGDYGYSISAGDVLRIRVFPKKKCEEVALVKDFLVETATSIIELELNGTDTKIGDIINKPTTYWYEIELNPDTHPQTIVGYNEDGPKIFMLYPEGNDSGELPSINTGKPVDVSDEAVESIVNNEIFKKALSDAENELVGNIETAIDKIIENQEKFINGDISSGDSSADNVDDEDNIPEYWQSALDNGVNAIRQAMETAGRNKSAFLFYSDAHWDYGSKMSPTLLKYLYKNTAMRKTFFGGDIVNSESTDRDAMEYLYEWRKMLKGLPNHHSVVGNHDDGNATNNLFDENYIYAYLLAAEETPDIVGSDSGMYYYIDEPCEKTRYLFLDTAYKDLNSLSDEQSSFITEALKSTQSGWHIVVVSHIWYMPDYDQYDVRPIPIAGLSTTAEAVTAILDNYNSRTDNFTDCGAWVEFCIGGHVHRDYVGSTDGGIPIILVETDSHHIRGKFAVNSNDKTTEASVNGIIADYENHKITVVRVGRGNGFTISLETGETHTHSYTSEITIVATCTTAGVRTYTCSCGDTYTESIAATGHTYVDGTCSVCGAESTDKETTTYTNVLDTVGYTEDRRLSGSTGELKTDTTDADTTGFIPCIAGDSTTETKGDTIYMKNVIAPYTDSSNYFDFVCFYDENQSFLTGYYINQCQEHTYDSDDNITSFVLPTSSLTDGTAYIRISAQDINENSIITVNQVIE